MESSSKALTPPEDVIKLEVLHQHQKQGLRWMIDREEYAYDDDDDDGELPPFWEERNGVYRLETCDFITLERPRRIRGGILADESGMGKTLTLLSLIAYTKKRPHVVVHVTKKRKVETTLPQQNKPTLVVCPPSVVATWKRQIEQWTCPGTLKCCTYPSENIKPKADANWLMQHDLVLTTYNVVSSSKQESDSLLHQIEWWRVILDDAHVFIERTRTHSARLPFINLKAKRRWAVTGKPIRDDCQRYRLYPMMKFLQLPLFGSSICPLLQSEVMSEIFSLRRTMPEKSIEDYMVVLSKDEQDTYDSMEAEVKAKLYSYLKWCHPSAKTATLHLWLSCYSLELCSLATEYMVSKSISSQELSREPELLKKIVNALQEEKDYACPVCMDQPEDFVITRCTHMFCRSCITRMFKKCAKGKSSCPLCRALLTMENIFSTQRAPSVVESSFANMSSKVSALLNLLIKLRSEDPSRKSIVLSQFQRILTPVAKALSEASFDVKRIDVIDSAEKKAIAVEEFTNADPPVILLTTLKASSNIPQGLDLSAAASSSNVYLLGPCWNVQNEREFHRYGEKEDDFKIVRLVGKNSIEERVLEIRKEERLFTESELEWIFGDVLRSCVTLKEFSENKLLLGLGQSYDEDFHDEYFT